MSITTLLLLGAIDPSGVKHTMRCSVDERLLDTKKSLGKWLESGVFKNIILFDSSGHSLDFAYDAVSAYPNICSEILSSNLQDFDRSRGKGYGVFRSLKYIMANSNLFGDSDRIVLVSARYYIRNAAPIIESANTDIVCNLSLNLTFAFDPFFIAKKDFFENYWETFVGLAGEDDEIYKTFDSPRICYEFCLGRAVHRAIADGYTWALPSQRWQIEAISGSTDREYDQSYLKTLAGRAYHKVKIWFFRGIR